MGALPIGAAPFGEHLAVVSPALDGLPEIVVAAAKDGQARILSTMAALVRSASATYCDDCELLAGELNVLSSVRTLWSGKPSETRLS